MQLYSLVFGFCYHMVRPENTSECFAEARLGQEVVSQVGLTKGVAPNERITFLLLLVTIIH